MTNSEGTAIASKISVKSMVGAGLRWALFFPVLIVERILGRQVPPLWTGLTLSVAAFLGFYDLIYGFFAYPLYDLAAEFSNDSLINSLTILAVTAAAQFASTVFPPLLPLNEVFETISGYLANGVLALAIQSVLLLVITKGLILKYVLGVGFLMLAIPQLARTAQRILLSSLVIFIVMPTVVGSEAWLYNTLKEPIEADISARYEELKDSLSFTAMMEGASDMVSDMFSDDEGEEGAVGEEDPAEDPGLFDLVESLVMAIFDGLILLFLLTLFTCLIAPIVAYMLIFKLLRELLTRDYFATEELQATAGTGSGG